MDLVTRCVRNELPQGILLLLLSVAVSRFYATNSPLRYCPYISFMPANLSKSNAVNSYFSFEFLFVRKVSVV